MRQIRAARPVDLPGLANVLQDAFQDKLRLVLGRNHAHAQTLLEAIYAGPVRRGYDGLLVAEEDGRVVGVLVIEPIHYTEDEHRTLERRIFQELGAPRLLWAAFWLWKLNHTPATDEAHIGGLGVAADWRGLGIGAQLLAAAEAWARAHGRARLTLWVAANNAAALRLYEKAGFAVTRTRGSLLTRWALGVRHWHFMEKPLAETAALSAPNTFPPTRA